LVAAEGRARFLVDTDAPPPMRLAHSHHSGVNRSGRPSTSGDQVGTSPIRQIAVAGTAFTDYLTGKVFKVQEVIKPQPKQNPFSPLILTSPTN